MMNLVQLQERLRDVPMQALMQYANGGNPQIPPFLALGELNRRKKMQETAAAEQAQEMEGAPTVKQQIEQATGLMALQGSRQRQAAQQQAGIQANAPMAAPNTTTSEPAQLASGGFIDDIVVPRDFQRGGMAMNPEMMKKLMMLQAMKKRRPGVAGLPANNLRRADYAGGGIVAFAGLDGSLVKGEDDEEIRRLLRSLASREQETVDPADPSQLLKVSATSDNYPSEGRRGSGSFSKEPSFSKPAMGQRKPSSPSEADIPSVFQPRTTGGAGTGGLGALSRFLKMDPERMFKAEEPRKFEDIMAEQKRRQGLAGISEDFLTDREARLADIQAKREAARAEQPMEQLSTFLTSIAEGRGGNWATQGARGAKASQALRSQQEALRDKQDMEMEELKFTVASKRDAIRRGDMKEAEALEAKEKDLKRDMMKNQIELAKGQASAETQGRQAEAYMMQATRPTDFERQKELYLQHARETGEKPTAQGFQRFMLGSKASTVMTMEDAIRIAATSLGPGATMDEIAQRAREIMRMSGNQAPGGAAAPKTVDFSQLPK